jgi:hypothetical protein
VKEAVFAIYPKRFLKACGGARRTKGKGSDLAIRALRQQQQQMADGRWHMADAVAVAVLIFPSFFFFFSFPPLPLLVGQNQSIC